MQDISFLVGKFYGDHLITSAVISEADANTVLIGWSKGEESGNMTVAVKALLAGSTEAESNASDLANKVEFAAVGDIMQVLLDYNLEWYRITNLFSKIDLQLNSLVGQCEIKSHGKKFNELSFREVDAFLKS